MRDIVIAGNWKMNKTVAEARELVGRMRAPLEAVAGAQTVLCPPFVSLVLLRELLNGSSIAVGAQNMFHEASGAFTGEVSPTMLADVCEYVILGHSERRQTFGETDAIVSRKVKAALNAGLRPIMCVGEQLEERDKGSVEDIVEQQVRLGLELVDSPAGLLVAYEPIWAIGTGKAATPGDAQQMMAFVRSVLSQRFSDGEATDVPLLYGGSVNAENVADFVRETDVDGALVGGASLDADGFVQLVRNAGSA